MRSPTSLVEHLKVYLNRVRGDNLDIDFNKMSDTGFDDVDETRFRLEHVTENLSESFELLDSGSTRDVYRIVTSEYGSRYEGKIIKFARSSGMREYNRREVQTWNAVEGTDIGAYFCPIRSFDPQYSWLIMDYAEPSAGTDDAEVIRSEIEKRVEKDVLDIHYNNIGNHHRRGKVVIDYSWGADFGIQY